MTCKLCTGEIFKQKLGRCKQCMWINLLMLVVGVVVYLFVDLEAMLAVQKVALLMFIAATAMLMSAHVITWCFYRFKSEQ